MLLCHTAVSGRTQRVLHTFSSAKSALALGVQGRTVISLSVPREIQELVRGAVL